MTPQEVLYESSLWEEEEEEAASYCQRILGVKLNCVVEDVVIQSGTVAEGFLVKSWLL